MRKIKRESVEAGVRERERESATENGSHRRWELQKMSYRK